MHGLCWNAVYAAAWRIDGQYSADGNASSIIAADWRGITAFRLCIAARHGDQRGGVGRLPEIINDDVQIYWLRHGEYVGHSGIMPQLSEPQ